MLLLPVLRHNLLQLVMRLNWLSTACIEIELDTTCNRLNLLLHVMRLNLLKLVIRLNLLLLVLHVQNGSGLSRFIQKTSIRPYCRNGYGKSLLSQQNKIMIELVFLLQNNKKWVPSLLVPVFMKMICAKCIIMTHCSVFCRESWKLTVAI